MITLHPEANKEIIETLDDTVEYLCHHLSKEGHLVSGETLWKIINCYSETKLAEFEGMFN